MDTEKIKALTSQPRDSFSLLKPTDPKADVTIGQSPFYPNTDMYQEVFNNFPAGLAILSLEGKVIIANPLFNYLTDVSHEKGEPFSLANAQNEVVVDFEVIHPLLNYPSHAAYMQLDRNIGNDEDSRWIGLHIGLIYNAKRQPLFFVLECRDIQAYKTQLHELQHQIMHDPLTGLGNRKYLEYEFNRALAAAKRSKKLFALFVIDVDKFKQINDTFGHEQGDQVLLAVASRLRQAVRMTDAVARLGGDEFIVVFNELAGHDDVNHIAIKITEACRMPIPLPDQSSLSVTISIGISIYPNSGANYSELFQKADEALYAVKQRGRDGYVIDVAALR